MSDRTCLNPADRICRKGCAGNAPCDYAPVRTSPMRCPECGTIHPRVAVLEAQFRERVQYAVALEMAAREVLAEYDNGFLPARLTTAMNTMRDAIAKSPSPSDRITEGSEPSRSPEASGSEGRGPDRTIVGVALVHPLIAFANRIDHEMIGYELAIFNIPADDMATFRGVRSALVKVRDLMREIVEVTEPALAAPSKITDEALDEMAYDAACADFPGDPAARHCFMNGYKWSKAIAMNAVDNNKLLVKALEARVGEGLTLDLDVLPMEQRGEYQGEDAARYLWLVTNCHLGEAPENFGRHTYDKAWIDGRVDACRARHAKGEVGRSPSAEKVGVEYKIFHGVLNPGPSDEAALRAKGEYRDTVPGEKCTEGVALGWTRYSEQMPSGGDADAGIEIRYAPKAFGAPLTPTHWRRTKPPPAQRASQEPGPEAPWPL